MSADVSSVLQPIPSSARKLTKVQSDPGCVVWAVVVGLLLDVVVGGDDTKIRFDGDFGSNAIALCRILLFMDGMVEEEDGGGMCCCCRRRLLGSSFAIFIID